MFIAAALMDKRPLLLRNKLNQAVLPDRSVFISGGLTKPRRITEDTTDN